MINNILDWLINSSVNPDEYSLTLKALLLTGTGSVVNNLQNLGLNVSVAQYTTEVGHAVAVVGIILTVFGFARKIFITTSTMASKAN